MYQPFDICGPTYRLTNRKADIQRAVNLFLIALEVQNGKAKYILNSVPGLVAFATLSGELRGCIEIGARAFVVAGSVLYEVFSGGATVSRGTLATSAGAVSMAYGLTQLVIVDGSGYVLTLSTNVFVQITDPDFAGANTVDFCDNYFVFSRDRKGQQFQISAINDATLIDGLDFASAESAPDDLVGHIVIQPGILLFGTLTCELFVNTGNPDFPFERSRGSGFTVGLMARASLCEIDNACMWVGRDKQGAGTVYRFTGGQPQRISTQSVEQAIQQSTDLTQARAFAYQDRGLTFYAVNAPGLASTWVYEVASGQWHERADLDTLGQFKASRGVCHLYFGGHFIGGSDGVLYSLTHGVYKNGSDPLVRERVTPHEAVPGMVRRFFSWFALDCQTGGAGQGIDPQAELSWSDDSGATYSNPVPRSTGVVGNRIARVLWTLLGSGKDRVWKLRFSANAPFSIINASTQSKMSKQ